MAKRGKKASKRQWRFPSIPWPNWENARRGLAAAASIAVVAGLLTAWIMGVPRLQAYATAQNQAAFMEVRFSDHPAWVQGDLEHLLVETVLAQLDGNPFNQGDLVAIREQLLNTGWFDEVKQVRRVHSERIDVEATFVDPYALIRRQGTDHLIDSRGRLLPRQFPAGAAEHFIVITGTRFPPPGRPGMTWDGADVIAALRLLRVLDHQPWREQVATIDVAGFVDGQPMRIVTDRGSTIVWGSAPGEEAPLEALTDRKLAYLNLHYQNHRHIDGGHAGEIDITDHERVFKR